MQEPSWLGSQCQCRAAQPAAVCLMQEHQNKKASFVCLFGPASRGSQQQTGATPRRENRPTQMPGLVIPCAGGPPSLGEGFLPRPLTHVAQFTCPYGVVRSSSRFTEYSGVWKAGTATALSAAREAALSRSSAKQQRRLTSLATVARARHSLSPVSDEIGERPPRAPVTSTCTCTPYLSTEKEETESTLSQSTQDAAGKTLQLAQRICLPCTPYSVTHIPILRTYSLHNIISGTLSLARRGRRSEYRGETLRQAGKRLQVPIPAAEIKPSQRRVAHDPAGSSGPVLSYGCPVKQTHGTRQARGKHGRRELKMAAGVECDC